MEYCSGWSCPYIPSQFSRVINSQLINGLSIDLISQKEHKFLYETSFFKKMGFLIYQTFVGRFKYYHGFLLSDLVCNVSGLGFQGFDSDGNPIWDLMTNVDIFGFEVINRSNRFNIILCLLYCCTECVEY